METIFLNMLYYSKVSTSHVQLFTHDTRLDLTQFQHSSILHCESGTAKAKK